MAGLKQTLLEREKPPKFPDFRVMECIEFLKKEIEKIDKEKDYHKFYPVFSILSLSLQKESKKEVLKVAYQELENLKIKFRKYLKADEEEEKAKTSYLFLRKTIDQIETLSLAHLYGFTKEYDGESYPLISYLLFELKNIKVVEDAFREYPYLVNTIDQEGKRLYVRAIDEFLMALDKFVETEEDENLKNLLYYSNILKILFGNEKLNINKGYKQKILKKLRQKLSHPQKEIEEGKKGKYLFWMNEILDILEKKNKNITEEYLSYRYDITPSFDFGILTLASRVEIPKNEYKRKLVDGYTLAIDSEGASEIDDALSIRDLKDGTYLLETHIADPIGGLANYPFLIEEALRRGTAVYLSDKLVPIFPMKLAGEKLSLLSGKLRLATSFYLRVREDGTIEDSYFEKTKLRLSRNISYEKCDKILKYGFSEDEELLESLLRLEKVTKKIREKMPMDSIYQLTKRQEKNTSGTALVGTLRSMKIVETAMVATNHIVASYFDKNHLPFIYRNHVLEGEFASSLEKLKEEIQKNREAFPHLKKYLNLYPSARYEEINRGHEGLSLPCYTHITSPLRRAADIVASTCLNEFYFHQPSDERAYEIEELVKRQSKKINARCEISEEYMRVYEKRKAL